MRAKRTYGKLNRSPKQVTRERQLREKLQREKPSLEDLVASGEYSGPLKQGAYMALMQIAAKLRARREALKLSLADVAERSGIDKAAISRIENGLAGNPTIVTLERLAGSLGQRLHLELVDCS